MLNVGLNRCRVWLLSDCVFFFFNKRKENKQTFSPRTTKCPRLSNKKGNSSWNACLSKSDFAFYFSSLVFFLLFCTFAFLFFSPKKILELRIYKWAVMCSFICQAQKTLAFLLFDFFESEVLIVTSCLKIKMTWFEQQWLQLLNEEFIICIS